MSALEPAIRVVLIDRHTLFRECLALALAREPGIKVVGTAGDGLTGQEIAIEQAADVVLTGIELPLASGIDITRQLTATQPNVHVIILSGHVDEGNVLQAVQAGARGYFPKTIELATLIRAIRAVAVGNATIDPSLTNEVLLEFRRRGPRVTEGLGALTLQERAMLACVAGGQSNKEICLSMKLSRSWVKNCQSNAFSKLGVNTRTQAAVYAILHGITPVPPPEPRVWTNKAA